MHFSPCWHEERSYNCSPAAARTSRLPRQPEKPPGQACRIHRQLNARETKHFQATTCDGGAPKTNKNSTNPNATSLHAHRNKDSKIAYALTWKRTSPFSKKLTIWFAAATPALLLASSVCAPIFFFVKISRFMFRSPAASVISLAF